MSANILEKVSSVFDIPGEAFAGMTRVTIMGTSRVHIENHRGIIGYSREEIDVSGRGVVVKIIGSELSLLAMSSSELVASGKISSVEYMC